MYVPKVVSQKHRIEGKVGQVDRPLWVYVWPQKKTPPFPPVDVVKA